MSVYKVGIMTSTALVEGPNAAAAALFYGLHTHGNLQLGVAVYECDGKAYEGDRMPWGKYAFNPNPRDAVIKEFEMQIKVIRPDVDKCHFVEES